MPPRHAAYKGEVARIILGTLPDAQRPCSTQELTMHVMAARGMNTADKRLVKTVAKRIGACLRHHRSKGVVNQTGKRRVVVALRQRKGRTLTAVFKSEDEALDTIRTRVEAGSVVYADEASSWDTLHGWFSAKRINHSVAFMDDGVCTNQAESYFSRLRRMVDGQHHHVSARYLHQYANHAAWMEDHRRLDNGALCHRALGLALGHGVSRQWKGYWQR